MLTPETIAELLARGVGRFESNPRVEILPAPPRVHRVMMFEPLYYRASDGRLLVARKGLVSDGASIPPALWMRLGSPLCSANRFGLPHDDLFRFAALIDGTAVTFDQANLYAFDMARCCGHSDEDALAIYEGLQLGGMTAWRDNEAKRVRFGADVAGLLAAA